MKSEKLIDALGKIDDDLVMEILPIPASGKKKSRWPMWVLAAAMVALCFVGVYRLGPPVDPDETVDPPLQEEREETPDSNPEADAVRDYLREHDQRKHTGFQQDARAVLTDYIQSNAAEFRYMPDFSATFAPDWEQLTLFVLMTGDYENTLTEAELETAVQAYMDVETEHRSSSELQYGNGLYTIMGRGLDEAPVCYGVVSVTQATATAYDIELAGIGFWYEDLFEQTAEHSRNWKQLQKFYPDLTAENLEQRMYEYLRTFGIGDFRVTERLTIKVKLQEGTHPFRYLACTREHIPEPQVTEQMEQELRYRLLTAQNPDNVSLEAKEAFLRYFVENPYEAEDYGSWDFRFSTMEWQGETVSVLQCRGPLTVTEGPSQCFQYSPKTGEVTYGASGSWTQEPYDAAEGVRRTLQTATSISRSDAVREALVRYYAANPQELEELEGFGEVGTVAYAVEECRIADAAPSYEYYNLVITLLGVGFTEADWSEDPSRWSYNRQKAEELVGPLSKDNFREKLTPLFYSGDPWDLPFTYTERVRLTVNLVLGKAVYLDKSSQPVAIYPEDGPFHYYGWARKPVPAVEARLTEDPSLTGGDGALLRMGLRGEDVDYVRIRINTAVQQFSLVSLSGAAEGFATDQVMWREHGTQEPGYTVVLELSLEPQVYAYGLSYSLNGKEVRIALSMDRFGNDLVVMEI